MLVARIALLVDGGSGVSNDRGLGDKNRVDADAFVAPRCADDVSLEGESVHAGGGAQQVNDARRVVLAVVAGFFGSNEASRRASVPDSSAKRA